MTQAHPAITIRFSPAQGASYTVDLRTSGGRDYAGAFALPYDASTWSAVAQALEPMFDIERANDDTQAALATLGPLDELGL